MASGAGCRPGPEVLRAFPEFSAARRRRGSALQRHELQPAALQERLQALAEDAVEVGRALRLEAQLERLGVVRRVDAAEGAARGDHPAVEELLAVRAVRGLAAV